MSIDPSEFSSSPNSTFVQRKGFRDILAGILMWLIAIAVVMVLLWILVDIFIRGVPELSIAFLISEPADAGLSGGIGPIIVSTLLILLVTLLIAAPLSLGTAIALSETRNSILSRIVRRCLDVLAAVPSIVFGLFGNAFFCVALGMGYSILAGGLTLACMILPILIRTTEQALRAVPLEYRLAASALGLTRTSQLFRVVIPVAAPSMGAGLVLSIGRALAETAALIFTAAYVARMPGSLFDSGRSMSVHIYDMAMNVNGGSSRAYATATVLVALLIIINLIANSLTRWLGLQSNEMKGTT